MRTFEEFLVTMDNFEYHTSSSAEKIELSEESPVAICYGTLSPMA